MVRKVDFGNQWSRAGVHNSIFLAGQTKIFACSRAKTDMFFLHIEWCFYERNRLNKQDFGLRGPYVVYAWSRVMQTNSLCLKIVYTLEQFQKVFDIRIEK